jgi:hypothetical protein
MLPSSHLFGVLKLNLINKLLITKLQEGGAKTRHKKVKPNNLGEILLLEIMHGETHQWMMKMTEIIHQTTEGGIEVEDEVVEEEVVILEEVLWLASNAMKKVICLESVQTQMLKVVITTVEEEEEDLWLASNAMKKAICQESAQMLIVCLQLEEEVIVEPAINASKKDICQESVLILMMMEVIEVEEEEEVVIGPVSNVMKKVICLENAQMWMRIVEIEVEVEEEVVLVEVLLLASNASKKVICPENVLMKLTRVDLIRGREEMMEVLKEEIVRIKLILILQDKVVDGVQLLQPLAMTLKRILPGARRKVMMPKIKVDGGRSLEVLSPSHKKKEAGTTKVMVVVLVGEKVGYPEKFVNCLYKQINNSQVNLINK